jgi:hypothetical protein
MRQWINSEIAIKNDKFFLFMAIYTLLMAVMIQKSISSGLNDSNNVLFESSVVLFFVLLLSFIIEIFTHKSITNNLLVIFLKSGLFVIVPFSLVLISVLKLDNGIVNFNPSIILGYSLISVYWFLLTTTSIVWLGWKSFFIFFVFLFSPAISEVFASYFFGKYLPFEIIITFLKKLRSEDLRLGDFGILVFYILMLFFLLKRKK